MSVVDSMFYVGETSNCSHPRFSTDVIPGGYLRPRFSSFHPLKPWPPPQVQRNVPRRRTRNAEWCESRQVNPNDPITLRRNAAIPSQARQQ
jgi:hypothetical protein